MSGVSNKSYVIFRCMGAVHLGVYDSYKTGRPIRYILVII